MQQNLYSPLSYFELDNFTCRCSQHCGIHRTRLQKSITSARDRSSNLAREIGSMALCNDWLSVMLRIYAAGEYCAR